MLSGVPTCGKSTFVNKLLRHDEWMDAVVLSTDTFIDNYALERNLTYNDVFDSVITKANDQLRIDLDYAVTNNLSIIWDQTNLTKKTRRKKSRMIPDDYYKYLVYFTISLEDALQRNKQRPGKVIPEQTLIRMHSQFENPTEDEPFDIITPK